MAGGQEVTENLTYTVADRLGGTVRNTLNLTFIGVNDPPVASDISASLTASTVPAGVTYRYFEGDFSSEAAFDTATPVSSGQMPTFSLDPATADTGYGLEMTGQLFVPATGPYTFYLNGNNASVLDIGETRVVGYDPAAPATHRSGTISLEAGSHPIRLRYFDVVEAGQLLVEYSGPGLPRTLLDESAFVRLPDIPLDPLAVATDPDLGDILRVSHINGEAIDESNPVRLPSGASLRLTGAGTLIYQPASGRTILHESTDTENFTFTVSDQGGLSDTASAQIQLARQNTAPLANAEFVFTTPATSPFGNIVPGEAFTDADGDEVRITHVNSVPLIGGNIVSLPSTAQISMFSEEVVVVEKGEDEEENEVVVEVVKLHYNGIHSFLFTLSRDRAMETFTLTGVDAAGAIAEITVTSEIQFGVYNYIQYDDGRFSPNLGPSTAEITNFYRFPVTMVTYVKHRETGAAFGHETHVLGGGWHALHLTFSIPEGEDLGDKHFFDVYDLHIDTPDGDPVLYRKIDSLALLDSLYSTATESFFRFTGAISPHWPYRIETARGTTFYTGGILIQATNYGGDFQVFRLDHLMRGASANKVDLEPTFAANIIIEGLCRTRDISRFSVENRNSENVPLTVGSEKKSVNVPAGSTVEFEVTYEPQVPILVLEGDLGLFDSNEVTCPQTFDFTVTSLCASPFQSFTEVRNNDPDNAYTVRIESAQYPSIRSDPMTIGNQSEEFIQMDHQGQNLQGTEGRLVVILPDREIVVETFTFSTTSCD